VSFDIKGGTQTVYSCENCGWCQTEKHFGEGQACLLCGGDGNKISEIQPSVGMSDFKYRELLTRLEEDSDGVGSTTVENIEEHFDEGDDFLDAAEAAYQEMEYDGLTAVKGVGDASAKSIALTMAEREGWENGAIFEM
jgi:hypothetical protein